MPFPVVFLPGNVVQPQAGSAEGMSVKKLEYVELSTLSDVVGGGDMVARTPDPQGRRFEYKRFLRRDLAKYERGEPLHSAPSLTHFKALVEGLIYGHLTLKTYDLRVFNFTIPNELRYLNVILDRRGRVVGGTDPEILVFSAATDLGDLELANNQSRTNPDGVQAEELLRGFKENLQARGLWDPNHILWMRLLDRLFFAAAPLAAVDLDVLRTGWRQVGPVMLRVSINAGVTQYKPFYLPTYEAGYLKKAVTALSGDVAPTLGAIQLMVRNRAVGKIIMPNPAAVGDQSPRLLGAGNLLLDDIVEEIPSRINYEQLRPYLQRLVTSLRAVPNPVQHVAQEAPFDFPDAIRIPIQHDGFIALDGLKGTTAGEFSERFIERMKGKRVLAFTPLQDTDRPPCVVQSQGIHCFAENYRGGVAYYVEEYQGERVEELRLLGYILWSIFDKSAQVDTDQRVVIMRGRAVLDFSGDRFEIKGNLQCEWPNPRMKAATLQRLVGVLDDPQVSALFRQAVHHWIKVGFSHPIQPLVSTPSPIDLGLYRWFINNL